jgi:hypothetical protein
MTSIWTPELDANLRRLWDSGITTKAMGYDMSLTKDQVIGRVHRLGFPPRPAAFARKYTKQPMRRDHEEFLASLNGGRTEVR